MCRGRRFFSLARVLEKSVQQLAGKAAPPPKHEAVVQVLLANLKACGRTQSLERGKQAHAEARLCGHDSYIYVANSLISMYAKCGSMAEARRVFDGIKHPNVVSWTALILGYADNGQGLTGLDLFAKMRSGGTAPNSVTLVAALKACASVASRDGESRWAECRIRGREIHGMIEEANTTVQNTLIDMYAKCGCMVEARQVFESIEDPTVVSWNVLILGYAENGQGLAALELFNKMKSRGPATNAITFVAALKACTSLTLNGDSGLAECRRLGKEMHHLAMENGFDSDIYVQCTLIDMHSKCGCMLEARKVFDSVKHPTAVLWNALITGYAENGQGLVALDLFRKMRREGPAPNSVTFLAALKACTSLATEGDSGAAECREWGKEVHYLAVKSGCSSEMYVQNSLIDMYSKCGSMPDAHQVFNSIQHPTVVSWNALILGYADIGQGVTALDLFKKMKSEGTAPNAVTFIAVLKACSLLGALGLGRRIHSQIESASLVLVNCLVDFYAKCGSLVEAQNVFDSHPETRDVITWNALMSGFSNCGNKEPVFELFEGLQTAGLRPDGITLLCILTCCSHAGLVEKGQACFDTMGAKYGVTPTVKHCNCMVDIFGRTNRFEDAMALLQRMPCSPNEVTWVIVLDACRKWRNVEIGRLAFQSFVHFNDKDGAGYVLMNQLYGSRGMLQEQKIVMWMRKSSRAWQKPAESCWTDEQGEVHTFLVVADAVLAEA